MKTTPMKPSADRHNRRNPGDHHDQLLHDPARHWVSWRAGFYRIQRRRLRHLATTIGAADR
ncbi:hypothetical protein AAFP30_09005 [Gordonia sp. CPCC 205515]|uniref:hypothetical protein n=1 Tax=Gordonia sp. CPCC 205515 TaxID=3140791 RepID=UPI003AF3356A